MIQRPSIPLDEIEKVITRLKNGTHLIFNIWITVIEFVEGQ